jgi:hypothetical protein
VKITIKIAQSGALLMFLIGLTPMPGRAEARENTPGAAAARRPAVAHKAARTKAAFRHAIQMHRVLPDDPRQYQPFCRLLGRNGDDNADAMLEVSVITEPAADGQAMGLTGLQIAITDYSGALPTITRCLIDVADARAISQSLGSILAHAADWKDRDVGYRGAAYQTPEGFGLRFTQDEARKQRAMAVCGQGAGKYVFADMGQVLLLKERIDRELVSRP